MTGGDGMDQNTARRRVQVNPPSPLSGKWSWANCASQNYLASPESGVRPGPSHGAAPGREVSVEIKEQHLGGRRGPPDLDLRLPLNRRRVPCPKILAVHLHPTFGHVHPGMTPRTQDMT